MYNLINHKYTVWFLFAVLCVVAFFLYAVPLVDPDLWWHLKIGEYLVKNLTLKPDHSIYSWTVADPNWVYNGWIPQIIFYELYSFSGASGLHFFNYVCLGVITFFLLFYHRILFKQWISVYSIFAILLIIVVLHINISQLKPESISAVFLTLTVFVYFYTISTGKNLFWVYPLIMILWVNSHGVFIFGMVFIIVAFIGELIQHLFSHRISYLSKTTSVYLVKAFFISIVVSCIALFITPYGHKWIISILTHFTDPQFIAQARELYAYKSIFVFAHPAKYILVLISTVYFLLTIYLLFYKKYLNVSVTILNCIFIYLSFMYSRTAYYYLPVWYFSITYLITIILQSKGTEENAIEYKSVLLKVTSLLICVVFLIFSSYLIHWVFYYPLKYRYVGFGIGEYMPDKVADFLLKYKLEGPMFNTYEIGGYLLWRLYPEYKVFIDPRHGPYAKNLSDDYRKFEIGYGFEEFTRTYPFKIAVVKLEWLYLFTNFYNSADWQLVYFDQSAALFAHKTVKLPNVDIDIGPSRFDNIRSYEALVHITYVYLKMNDFKSTWYIVDLIKRKYFYGNFKEIIYEMIHKIENYERKLN